MKTHLDLQELQRRRRLVEERIHNACAQARRPESSVRLLAATKARPIPVVEMAREAGLVDLGENYVQELCSKADAMADPSIHWHFIGHLQRNKAKLVARHAHRVHSVDSLRLAVELGRRSAALGRTLLTCLEVNVGGEESKSGFSPSQVREDFQTLRAIKGLAIDGLMTLPPFRDDPKDVGPFFALLRSLRDELQEKHSHPLPELSMGMSADLEVAIAEGATWVRVGTALFGPRPPRPLASDPTRA